MKGRITKDGALEIMRGGKWKAQYCPNVVGDYCCDSCPKFQEPCKLGDAFPWSLTICDNTYLEFTDFTDERVDHVADAGEMVKSCGNCGTKTCCLRGSKIDPVCETKTWTPKKTCANCEALYLHCGGSPDDVCENWTPKKEGEYPCAK